MQQTYASGDTQALLRSHLDFVSTDGCCMHPQRRRIRHIRSIHLRDISAPVPSKKKAVPPIRRGSIHETNIISGRDIGDLMEIYSDKLYNVFCSLQDLGGQYFHISEVCKRTINADFNELTRLESQELGRSTSFTLKVWLSTFRDPEDWKLLIQHDIDLSHLLYLNKEIDSIPSLNINNCILISLVDGVYILPTKEFNIEDYKAVIYDDHQLKDDKSVPSLTYDHIMKLNNLDKNIEDVNQSKFNTSRLIDVVFKADYYDDSVANHHFKLNRLNTMIQHSVEYSHFQKAKLRELRELKDSKFRALARVKQRQTENDNRSTILKQEYSDLLTLNETVKNDLIIAKNEKIKELMSIFPREEIYDWLKISKNPTQGEGFSFLEILPTELNLNSLNDLVNINDQKAIHQVNAGFGYLAQIVFILSRYLSIPLRYQIKPFGSTSYIIDNISQIHQRKAFPLFYTNHFYRFQYAVILLDRNIKDILKEEDSLIHY